MENLLIVEIKKIESEDLIEAFGYNKENISFVQIGANDGEMDDPINKYVSSHNWRGIMVEPDFYYFEKLRNKYKDNKNVICLNLGIGDGTIKTLFRINPSEIHTSNSKWEKWVSGMGTCVEDQLTHYDWIDSKDIEQIKIITVPLMSILNNYKKLDLLLIDAEGMDIEILNQLDLDNLQPNIIIFENDPINNLPYNENSLNNVLSKFRKFNYNISKTLDHIILEKQ